ncbi:MAG: permease-like cell division protein FtsX [Thermodesulfobacteriota bacterium]
MTFPFIKRALRDLRSNLVLHSVTVIIIALSVLIVGTFTLFSVNAAKVIRTWEKGARLLVYMADNVPRAEIDALRNDIARMEGVTEIRFIPREEALARLTEKMKWQTSLVETLDTNPLPDALEVWIDPARKKWETIEMLAIHIQSSHLVSDVEYGQSWLKRFTGVLNLFRFSGAMMSAVFFLAAVFIVANTIRLVFWSRHEEFKIMRLVGATDRFIKAPFYLEGLIQGAAGAVLGLAALYVVFIALTASIDLDAVVYAFSIDFIPVGIIFIIFLCSMFAGWLGCYISLRQFLKE